MMSRDAWLRTSSPMLALLVGLQVSPPAEAAGTELGRWVPANGAPFTLAQQERLRADGGVCMEIINKRAAARASVFRPGQAAEEGLPDGIDPVFADCMESHSWLAVDDAEFQARRVLGGAEDCLLGIVTECAEFVNLYIHGDDRNGLDPRRGLEVGETLCRRGDGDVCFTLSSLYLQSNEVLGLKRNPATALEYADKGCDLESEQSCAFAGMLLTNDIEGLATDPARGRRYLDRACKLGNIAACRPDPPPSTSLPTDARWCRYGQKQLSANTECPPVAVGWLSLPRGQACLEQVRITVDRCELLYVLDPSDAVGP